MALVQKNLVNNSDDAIIFLKTILSFCHLDIILQEKEEAEAKQESQNSGKSAQFIRYVLDRIFYYFRPVSFPSFDVM